MKNLIIAIFALIVGPATAQTFTSAEPLPVGAPIADCGRKGDLYRYGAGKCPDPLFGANLSGAEASGGDAVRPTLDDLKLYIDRYGFKLIRYPFKPDRMTPARIAELRTLTDYARSKGVPMILDAHTYKWLPPGEMVAQWTAFAPHFPDDGSVILDLVNEPKGFDDPIETNDFVQWARDTNVIIAGLRANGIKHPIAIEYPQWSASFRFDKGEGPAPSHCGSAGCALDRIGGLKDPLNLTFINAHRYFDYGSSGTRKDCRAVTSKWVQFAAQLRKRGLKAYITEAAFGSSSSVHTTCVAVGKEAIAALKANSDVLLGITWWGGGRIWPESYIFKIDPPKTTRFTAPVPDYVRRLTGAE
ncbi:hypothetical protein HNO88_002945 [Novosphingobium chloroacetimidivorans]|uniref:Glycoside hydrolase family 5 domain-containing protein n=1 Tax=Novosphingobium chloroacetimidivorans TaxID=1428314 RepID=A0A7W7KB99_9SPHN|nr:cellulase family glycosylhydrolase [Novosphingobium chloroacetimidivorans]MBB4859616.1 hypothetical protein [Novosphingobium chloroacetimidivorans]